MMEKEKMCGTCKWNRHEKQRCGIDFFDNYFCGNEDSDNYQSPTAYGDGCEDWEKRDA